MKSKHTSHFLHLLLVLWILTTVLLCQGAQAANETCNLKDGQDESVSSDAETDDSTSKATALELAVIPQATEQTFNIKFRTYSIAGEISDLSYGDLKQPQPALISQKRRSEVMSYKGLETLMFFRISELAKLKEGEPVRPAAVVELQEGVRNPLLIFLKHPLIVGELQTYDVCVIKDDPKDFSDGSVKFFNHTMDNLHLQIGHEEETRMVVKPGTVLDYKLPTDFSGNLPIKIEVEKDEKFTTVLDSRIFPELSVRDIYFISAIPGRAEGNTVKIHTLRERGDVAEMRLK